ncbi:hypothetical protein [Thermohalobacter berrensis]|uniref:Uncharacterized protein n=1 Tax=Thermohalobacter berrensis TaxID=99594 RepID=A0A419SV85_9FIRM|nr:hypothetical protein [Thermohalobacter berrensis]RKD29130.1 hypothetical protein BET03_06175 [Thermohalobacter berrensis]
MLSLVRRTAKILLLESNNIAKLENCLIEKFGATKYDIDTAFENASQESTIIFIVDKLKPSIRFNDAKSILVLQTQTDVILSCIINAKQCNLISSARIAPVMLIMRTFGDVEKIIDKIQQKHRCEVGSIDYLWQKYSIGSLIAFTEKPLNKVIKMSDLYEKGVYVSENYVNLIEEFRIKGFEYLNAGINNKDWYELEIKIYDRYSKYRLHYQRLLKIIENLELGLILGEAWGKDGALIFLYVQVYRVRLFTLYKPEYIKKILLGLEHLDDGTRIVDYDLFYNKKKIHWTDLKDRKGSRADVSKKYRKEIFSQLSEETIDEVLKLEKKILETRD